MIEPTDEMVAAAYDAAYGNEPRIVMHGVVAAVLADVERDYRIEPKPPWEREPNVGLCCIGYAPCQGRPGCNGATP